MPVALVKGPSVLWRVGRPPGVFTWRLPQDRELLASDERPRLEGNRWDDPDGETATLYCATTPLAAFLEVLAQLRSGGEGIVAEILQATGEDSPDPRLDPALRAGVLPAEFLADRCLAKASAARGPLFIDMASPQTHNLLGERLPHVLRYLGAHQFDRGVVMSQDRRVTRQIAGFLREYADSDLRDQGPVAGLRYESRIAAEQTCWAIWQDRLQLSDEQQCSITGEHPDLLEAAELLDIKTTAAETPGPRRE
jgi:RES domain